MNLDVDEIHFSKEDVIIFEGDIKVDLCLNLLSKRIIGVNDSQLNKETLVQK
jgi:hypothetical protein